MVGKVYLKFMRKKSVVCQHNVWSIKKGLQMMLLSCFIQYSIACCTLVDKHKFIHVGLFKLHQ